MVGIGVVAMGVPAAVLVTVFDFPGRRSFEWLLLLPLAMPAYVTAYAYTDFLQFSGPLQSWLRASFGLEGRLLPEVRSVWGAAWVFSFSLYPYVYLLSRTALAERAPQLMEAARLLGASLPRRLREVALPMARPAVAAGTALALMEVLADYGVSVYFGIQTFTAGIYKAWLSMDNRIAAAQLATVLLALVMALLWLEQRAQRRLRFVGSATARASSSEARPIRLRGRRARWQEQAAALHTLDTGKALLLERGHLGQKTRAARICHAQHPHPARGQMRQAVAHAEAPRRHLPTHQVLQARGCAAVGQVRERNARCPRKLVAQEVRHGPGGR